MSAAIQLAEQRWQWTADRYQQAVDAGLVDAGLRYELVNGQLIEMPAQNPPHAQIIRNITEPAVLAVHGTAWSVSIQSPIWLSETSNREPDLAIVRGEFGDRHPEFADIALVLEVSDRSQSRDRGEKRDLYAAHGVPEYWVVSVEERTVHVHRGAEGYAAPMRWTRDSGPQELAPLAAAMCKLTHEGIFAHL